MATVVSTPFGVDLAGRHHADETAASRAQHMPVRVASAPLVATGAASTADIDLAVSVEQPAEPGLLEGIVGAIVSFLFG